jgi:hypothetical protein
MANILTITSVNTSTNATAEDDKYKYNVNYTIDSSKNLTGLNIRVTDKDTNVYAGSASLNGDNKSVNAPDSSDISLIVSMLDAIAAEIKATLTA